MSNEFNKKETVLVCNKMGIIEKILYPQPDENSLFKVDQNILRQVDPLDLSRGLSFVFQLNHAHVATNHLVDFKHESTIQTLNLNGFLEENHFMVMVSETSDSDRKYNDELMAINNDQINIFRKMLKDYQREQEVRMQVDSGYFDEISKLNNELMNSKRTLAQKNQELERLNAKLENLVIKDPLTGLYNRRILYKLFEEERRRAKRLGYALTLVVIDINGFKQVNDLLGHNEGDAVLIQLAELIKLKTRESLDHSFRMGGDEFLLLLTSCQVDEAHIILKRIDTAFRQHTSLASLAYGAVEVELDGNSEVEHWIKIADQKMYEHKKATGGRHENDY